MNLGGWMQVGNVDPLSPACGQVHIIPVDDLKPHACSESCWCLPVEQDDPMLPHRYFAHQSMDGREPFETG